MKPFLLIIVILSVKQIIYLLLINRLIFYGNIYLYIFIKKQKYLGSNRSLLFSVFLFFKYNYNFFGIHLISLIRFIIYNKVDFYVILQNLKKLWSIFERFFPWHRVSYYIYISKRQNKPTILCSFRMVIFIYLVTRATQLVSSLFRISSCLC